MKDRLTQPNCFEAVLFVFVGIVVDVVFKVDVDVDLIVNVVVVVICPFECKYVKRVSM